MFRANISWCYIIVEPIKSIIPLTDSVAGHKKRILVEGIHISAKPIVNF